MSFNKQMLQREADSVDAPAIVEKDYGYKEQADVVDEVDEVIDEPVKKEEVKAVENKPEVKDEKPVDDKPADAPVNAPNPIAVDWKTSIKAVDRYEVLKEAGFDDFEIEMLRYKEKTGDLTPYLQVKTVDYSKMSPEQLLKAELAKQNPGMSDKALDFKFKKDFESKYYTNRDDYPEDSDEAVYGAEQLRLDSESKRRQFIEEQSAFKAPEPKPNLDASKKEIELQQKQERQKGFVTDSPVTKTLLTAKSITFGEGEESFNYPIADTQSVINDALTAAMNADLADMTPEALQNFYKALAIGKDVAAYTSAAVQHGRSLGVKKVQNEIQNITPIKNTQTGSAATERDYSVRHR